MNKTIKTPDILLDCNGYPSKEFLRFIKNYTFQIMPILDFLSILKNGWYYGDWGFKLSRKYKDIRKLELHTGGWSGNEEIISAILDNIYLTHFQMRYVKWETGGHYYFEINCKLCTRVIHVLSKNDNALFIPKLTLLFLFNVGEVSKISRFFKNLKSMVLLLFIIWIYLFKR